MKPSIIVNDSGTTLILPNSKGMKFIALDKILYFEADNIYTYLVTTDLARQAILCSIKSIEDHICNSDTLIRIHKKFIVSIKQIKLYSKSEGGYVVLENNIQLPVSRHRKEDFRKRIGL